MTRGRTTSTVDPPAVPAGGKDCGIINEIAGWPTTFVQHPVSEYACVAAALAAGDGARLVVVSPGKGSGRKTRDGFELPNRRLLTWIVRGKAKLQQTTDLREDGGGVTTVMCTGWAVRDGGYLAQPTGCSG